MEVVERVAGRCGELVLRCGQDGHHDVIANGMFLMDTRDGTSERLLVTAAADRMRPPGRLMVGGLGVGFSLAAALAHPRVTAVHLVEREPAVVRWNRGPLAHVHGDALVDPRVVTHVEDVVEWLRAAPPGSLDAICLDVDNGPGWLVTPGNVRLYDDAGLANAVRVLAPGGVLATWSAAADPAFVHRLARHFPLVEVLDVPRGEGAPDVVIVGSGWVR